MFTARSVNQKPLTRKRRAGLLFVNPARVLLARADNAVRQLIHQASEIRAFQVDEVLVVAGLDIDVGGMPELVSDEGGLLIEVPDVWDKMCYPEPEEMVEAVVNIMSDLDGWRQKARQRAVTHFSKDHWLKQHHQIFTELL